MRELIEGNSLLLLVISRFGISLGFGDDSIGKVCEAQNVDCRTFLTVANFIDGRAYNATEIDLHSLITYLKGAHAYFLDYFLPAIGRRLFEVIGYSGEREVGSLLMRYFDEYVSEVRRHMLHENNVIFGYVEGLLDGKRVKQGRMNLVEAAHGDMTGRLRNFIDIIMKYYPRKNHDTLNSVLIDLMACEKDLVSHSRIEDLLLVPNVKRFEETLQQEDEGGDDDSPVSSADDLEEKLKSLTERERDVVVCVAKGLANKEIAEHLCLSVHTVTTYRHSISVKLDIHSAAGITIFAIISRLVDIADIKPV